MALIVPVLVNVELLPVTVNNAVVLLVGPINVITPGLVLLTGILVPLHNIGASVAVMVPVLVNVELLAVNVNTELGRVDKPVNDILPPVLLKAHTEPLIAKVEFVVDEGAAATVIVPVLVKEVELAATLKEDPPETFSVPELLKLPPSEKLYPELKFTVTPEPMVKVLPLLRLEDTPFKFTVPVVVAVIESGSVP